MQLNDLDNALADYSKAIKMKANDKDWLRGAYENRAKVYEKQLKFQDAINDYTLAFDCWYSKLGVFAKENNIGSSVAYDILRWRADARRKIKDYSKAVEDYRSAIEWGGKFFPHMIFGDVGDTFIQMERYEEAIAEYNKAISKNNIQHPEYETKKWDALGSEYYVKIAQAYSVLNKPEKALENYKLALNAIDDLPPLKEDVYVAMAKYYHFLGIKNEELKCFREAVASAEFNGVAQFENYSLLAWAEFEAGNPEDAMQILNGMVKLFPNEAEAYSERGQGYIEIKDYPRAVADFNKALSIVPTHSGVYFFRADAYFNLGQNDKGIKDLQVSARLGHPVAQKRLKENSLEW